MKATKRIATVLTAICLTFGIAVSASAATVPAFGSTVFTVKYNGAAVVFPDAQPFVDSNNRTLVPIRFVAETMGATVNWNQDKQTASIEQNGILVQVPVGSKYILVTKNGTTTSVSMDTAAIVKNERTFVPARYVAEALGAWVGYSDLFATAQIYRDTLAPADINRLHYYYDSTWQEYNSASGFTSPTTDADWAKLYPQITYFTGANGFANANEWKMRNPNKGTFTGDTTGTKFTSGTSADSDFAKLILAEAKGAATFLTKSGKLSASLKTDLSCVFQSRHDSDAFAAVRGVLTVTLPDNADVNWIKTNCPFITDPKPGSTYNYDVEIPVTIYGGHVGWRSIDGLTVLK